MSKSNSHQFSGTSVKRSRNDSFRKIRKSKLLHRQKKLYPVWVKMCPVEKEKNLTRLVLLLMRQQENYISVATVALTNLKPNCIPQ